jgi:hypothetical protein
VSEGGRGGRSEGVGEYRNGKEKMKVTAIE